jgi:hypothetical protein
VPACRFMIASILQLWPPTKRSETGKMGDHNCKIDAIMKAGDDAITEPARRDHGAGSARLSVWRCRVG